MSKLRFQPIKFFGHIIELFIYILHRTFLFLKPVSEEIIMLKLQRHKASNIVLNFFQPSKVRINAFRQGRQGKQTHKRQAKEGERKKGKRKRGE